MPQNLPDIAYSNPCSSSTAFSSGINSPEPKYPFRVLGVEDQSLLNVGIFKLTLVHWSLGACTCKCCSQSSHGVDSKGIGHKQRAFAFNCCSHQVGIILGKFLINTKLFAVTWQWDV
jgi:hypothetical protein